MRSKILAIGDVTGEEAIAALEKRLPALKKEKGIDFTVVNGENCLAGRGNGIDRESYRRLIDAGADVVTTGNHVFAHPGDFLDDEKTLLRPLNYPDEAPGHGVCDVLANGISYRVINLIGTVSMEGGNNPFGAVNAALKPGGADVIIVDMHAEATSEKRAMGFFLDGRATVCFGTHTHVPTADAQILPNGTAYVTDVGMCGPRQSVLGLEPQLIIDRFRTSQKAKFVMASGDIVCMGIIVTAENGKASAVERIEF
ncbi:MAG: YmdB family metallophosphoesterase [Clostridia bacterium]|nr:YmdB family metallophosphoesterase [Clostridia bacterium]